MKGSFKLNEASVIVKTLRNYERVVAKLIEENFPGTKVLACPLNYSGLVLVKTNVDAERLAEKIKVKVLEVDREKNRLVFSERLASEPEEVEQERKLIAKIKPGDKFKAEVVRVEPFGLFVRIKVNGKPLEGLVHISEVSWEKVEDLPSMYQVGDKTEVILLNKEDGRLQFSIKRLKPDPWENIEEKYPMDQQFKGEVVRLASFGALVRLEPGIEGLIHISKILPEAKL